ncbi:MAG: InlB B-repeat-containing protein [Treponema sp.]|nr:InlB B-repeat-containing protein [Treponema sp.]
MSVAQFFNADERFRVKNNPFSRKGYQFLGWSETPNSNVVMYNNRSELSFSGDKDLYAVWEVKNYLITYNTNGGRRFVLNPEYFTIEKSVILNPVHNGNYIFGGWYEDADFSGKPVLEVKQGTVGDRTFYARWYGKIYYHANGGVIPSEADPILFPAEFDGSDTQKKAFEKQVLSHKKSDVTESADEKTSKMTPDSIEESQEKTEDDVQSEKPAKTKIKNFADTEENVDTDSGEIADVASKDVADEASEEVAETTAKEVADTNAEEVADTNAEEVADTNAEEVADTNAEEVADTNAEEVADTTDTAVSEADSVIDTDNTAQDTGEKEVVEVPQTISDVYLRYYTVGMEQTLVIPEKDGYVFGGWYYDEKYTRPVSKSITPSTAEIVVYAKWNEIKAYTITYELNGGSNADNNPTEYKNSKNPVALEEPVRYGYIFDGWYTTPAFSSEAVSEISAFDLGDKTFYAKWNRATFTVTYCAGNADEGEPPEEVKALYESEVSASDNDDDLARKGCSFIGWIVTPDDGIVEADEDSADSDDSKKPDENAKDKLAVAAERSVVAQRLLASSDFVQPGEKFAVVRNVKLYPVWKLAEYTPIEVAKRDEKSKVKAQPFNSYEKVVLPGYVKQLGNAVFAGFSSLKSFDFTGVTNLGKYAFSKCLSLSAVDLTQVQTIGNGTFEGCSHLKTVVLPENLNHVGKGVFVGCPDGIQFVTTKDKLASYEELLTPGVVGKPEKTYTILAIDAEY